MDPGDDFLQKALILLPVADHVLEQFFHPGIGEEGIEVLLCVGEKACSARSVPLPVEAGRQKGAAPLRRGGVILGLIFWLVHYISFFRNKRKGSSP